MAISYCSAPDKCFSYTTGTGIPAGMCLYNGALMTIEEALQAGIDNGERIEFRKTESFMNLLEHFFIRYGPEKVREYTLREELDFIDTIEILKNRIANRAQHSH